MKSLINLARVTVLTACAIWLMTRTSSVHAFMTCPTYYTEDGVALCNSCCTSQQYGDNWTPPLTTGDGIQSLNINYAACGSPTTSCPGGTSYTGCMTSNNAWAQAANNAACCFPTGFSCTSNPQCCNGLICLSNNKCNTCIANFEACGTDSDCCGGNCYNGTCSKCPVGCTPVGESCECCPIVLDTTGHGFQLTDIAHGVYFQWEPDGPRYAMSWTDPAGGNGWLVLPDKNGEVHDSTNLFSSSTPQPKTANPNGYIALAVYDLPSEGGNGNGWIDPGDKIYSQLRVWIDANQDGEAQPGELHSLSDLGIKQIGLRYRLAEKVDQYGNVFRYVSQVLGRSDPKDYDVWIKLDPDATRQ